MITRKFIVFVVFLIFILMIVGSHSVFAEKPIFSDWIGSFAKWWVAEVLLDQEFENTEIKTDIAIPLDKPTGFGLLKSDGKTTNEISSVIYDDIYTAKNKNNPLSLSSSLSYEFADVGMGASYSIQTTDNIKLDKYFLYVESIPASATNIENTVLSAVKFMSD